MAAISRNTQAVAQDFHNSGGGKTKGKNMYCCRMNGQKLINEFLHSIDTNINSNKKNSKNMVPDQGLIMGPSISPPANHKKCLINQIYLITNTRKKII